MREFTDVDLNKGYKAKIANDLTGGEYQNLQDIAINAIHTVILKDAAGNEKEQITIDPKFTKEQEKYLLETVVLEISKDGVVVTGDTKTNINNLPSACYRALKKAINTLMPADETESEKTPL